MLPGKITAILKGGKRRYVQLGALLFSNAFFLGFLNFIPCGYLQCSNCALSTFSCPLILVQRGAVMVSMGLFGMMGDRILISVGAALAMLVLFGSIFGTWGCGWLCPFGFLQDLVAKIPVRKMALPGWAGHLRIPILLGLVVAIPYATNSLFFCDVCPPGAVNRLWQQAAGIPLFFKTPEGIMAAVSIGFLLSILTASVFIQRPFCSLFCPIGGVLGAFNKVSGLYLNVDKEHCTSCGKCGRVCPQGLSPADNPSHTLCSRCLECTGSCEHIHTDVRL